MSIGADTGVQYSVIRPIPYHVFLKRISNATSIPINTLHSAICAYAKKHGTIEQKLFNENSVAAFCGKFTEWKIKKLAGRFSYQASAAPVGATALTHADGTPLSEIAQGRIGVKFIEGTPSKKYLYDAFAYDSPLEKNNLLADIDEVIVYGKIPRNSIAIPTIAGGTYSPDFIYVVKLKDGTKVLIVVETKDVENKTDLRGIEKVKIECAEVFFNTLAADGYKVSFRTQLGNKQIRQIVNEVLGV